MRIKLRQIDATNELEMSAVYAIEAQCFSKAERDSNEIIYQRAVTCGDCFWVLENEDNGEIIGFINAMPTEQQDFTEDVFTDLSLYNQQGPWVMLISLDIAPKYQKQHLSRDFIASTNKILRDRGIYKGGVFICKERLVPYYTTFGFVDEGISKCRHGGAQWHQMRMWY